MTTKTRRGTRVNADAPTERVRYTVVGLGWIAQTALLPAFAGANLDAFRRGKRLTPAQEIHRPLREKAKLVHVEDPTPS